MQVRIECENVEVPVSPFVGRFVSNVCTAIVASLKTPSATKSIEFDLRGEKVGLQIDGSSVPLALNQGFAEILIGDTLTGMVRRLKGVDPQHGVRISVTFESGS